MIRLLVFGLVALLVSFAGAATSWGLIHRPIWPT